MHVLYEKKNKQEELQMPTLGDIYTVPLNMCEHSQRNKRTTTSVLYTFVAFIIT